MNTPGRSRSTPARGAASISDDTAIPLSDLDYDHHEEEAALRVLRRRWLSTGPEVRQFEEEVAALVGVRHAVAVANGTAALHLALLALGVGPGDEVIQPAINFVAAANVTRLVGAEPVLADIVGVDEPVLDPAEVERLLTPRTRAVVVMHYGGYATRLVEIARLCRARNIALVEDACHALGAGVPGAAPGPDRPAVRAPVAGGLGDLSCFSFFSNKNLAIGEGGMVVTDSADLSRRVALLRSHGMTSLSWDRHNGHATSYDVVANGLNYRLDDLRAALGRAQLAKLRWNNERRRRLVELYRSRLRSMPGMRTPFDEAAIAHSACHLMPVVAPSGAVRGEIAAALRRDRIQSSLHYPSINSFAAFADVRARVPRSEDYAARTLTLPLYPTLEVGQVHRVCDAVQAALRTAVVA